MIKREAAVRPGFAASNARTDFHGFAARLEESGIWARLPSDRGKKAEFYFSDNKRSIAATVNTGRTRQVCQDSAVVFACGDFIATGVFDGFGANGTFLSEGVADMVIALCRERGKRLAGRVDAKALLTDAVQKLLEERAAATDSPSGGTTATFAIVLPDGRYSIASVADSAAYVIRAGHVNRLFDYNRMAASGTSVKGMGVRLYTALRNVVNQTIDVEGLQETAIETASGVLCAGETLLIVSDGVTKNLRMKIDPESGVICEASGCEDMERILRKKQDIVGAVYEMVWRRTAMFHERIIIKGDNALSGADDDVALVSLTTR